MLVARRVSPKRYANFAKCSRLPRTSCTISFDVKPEKYKKGLNVLSKRKEIRHTLSILSTFLTIVQVRPQNDNAGTRAKLIENKSTLRNGFNGSLY